METVGGKGSRDSGANPEDQQPPEEVDPQTGGNHREGSEARGI